MGYVDPKQKLAIWNKDILDKSNVENLIVLNFWFKLNDYLELYLVRRKDVGLWFQVPADWQC